MMSFRSRATALALATVGALSMPAMSIAACDQWNMTGRWQFWQGNNLKVQFDLVQDAAGQIRGSGTYVVNPRSFNNAFSQTINVSIEKGSIKGNTFLFVTSWDDGRGSGRYVGTVNTDGAISGVASDLSNSSQTFPFHEFDGRKAACTPTPSAASTSTPPSSASTSTPPSSAPKKVVSLGKMKDVATAIDDVNIHAAPDGQSKQLGILRAGGTGTVVGYRTGWYQLNDFSIDLVGAGWVAEDHLKVKRVRR